MKNDLIKMHMPIDDSHVMGMRPKLKDLINRTIDKVKITEYMCEETLVLLEELKQEMDKL